MVSLVAAAAAVGTVVLVFVRVVAWVTVGAVVAQGYRLVLGTVGEEEAPAVAFALVVVVGIGVFVAVLPADWTLRVYHGMAVSLAA